MIILELNVMGYPKLGMIRAEKISEYVLGLNERPNVVVFTEVQFGKAANKMIEILERDGAYKCYLPCDPLQNHLGVIIAVNKDGENVGERFIPKTKTDGYPRRHLAVEVNGVIIMGVYVPTISQGVEFKQGFWGLVHNFADEMSKGNALIIGDFNEYAANDAENGVSTDLCCNLCELKEKGWNDAWLIINPDRKDGDQKHYTWYRKNGFRLDYGFLSPKLRERIISAKHLHDVRASRISDHSALIIEIKD